MGCGASADLNHAISNSNLIEQGLTSEKATPLNSINGKVPWFLPDGGYVVALSDFDPLRTDWPRSLGIPLPLSSSMLVQVTGDEGNGIAYGYLAKHPGKQGYFPKQYAMPLVDCLGSFQVLDSPRLDKAGTNSNNNLYHISDGTSLKSCPRTCASPDVPEVILNGPIPPPLSRQRRMPQNTYETVLEYKRGPAEIKPLAKNASSCRVAVSLGLRDGCDEPFRWLIGFAEASELPSDWERFLDDEGREAFYHPATKRVSRQHPMMVKYKHFLNKLRAFHERSGVAPEKVRPHMALILNEMLNRCHKELPPVTPEIVERIAFLLSIDTSVDYFLATQLKVLIETFVEDQYDVAVQVHEKADVDSFINKMRAKQVEMEVLAKPDVVIMCSELESLPASVKCEQCLDYFSWEGFAKVHRSGRRKAHTAVKCEQSICSVYANEFATCDVEGTLYCDRAYEEIAGKSEAFRQKRRRILRGLFCSQYPGQTAEVLCEDCSDLFCWEAFIELHNHGNRRQHVPLRLNENNELLRAGEVLSPAESSRLLCRSRSARDGGPWLAFRDDQLNSYWYHLRDKAVTPHNPYL